MDAENNQGAVWNGETLTLTKLLTRQFSCSNFVEASNINLNNSDGTSTSIENAFILDKSKTTVLEKSNIPWEYMSIQDAIDFVKFAFDATINHMKFQNVNKTVGGPIDILIIKPNSVKWLKRKKITYDGQ